jgi:O-antigen ligase
MHSTTQIDSSDSYKSVLQQLNTLLIIAFGFLLPITVAGVNILALIIFLLWLAQADFRKNLSELGGNLFIRAILAFWMLHLVGFLWSSDWSGGMEILAKESMLLLIPVLMTALKKDRLWPAIYAFIASMLISSILSFLIFRNVITHVFKTDLDGPIPFMDHLSYSPFLVVAIYLSLYTLLFDPQASPKSRVFAAFSALVMSINVFITIGRAGQVLFFLMIAIVIFQYFQKRLGVALVIAAVALPLLFSVVYYSSDIFRSGFKEAISNIEGYHKNEKNTNVGLRLAFAENSLEIFRNHPILGVGTGDFKSEYASVNKKNTPQLPATVQPHNMYLLEMAQFGVIGLASLLFILFTQIRMAVTSQLPLLNRFGIALPLLFAVMMLSDSYLLGHFTTMLFIFFSSILYRVDA